MEPVEARSAVKSIYLLSASLAGLEVSPQSPEQLAKLANEAFGHIESKRRPEAVSNLLKIIAMALQLAQDNGETTLNEGSVPTASEKVCPVYPFG